MVKICLNMIIKNESKIIKRCLDNIISFVDYIVLTDTGSTDDTINICNQYIIDNNINGKIYTDLWVNFAVNRTNSINNAKEFLKSKKYNFGDFMNIMEGKSRPDHFDGVATVVEKLFKIFTPNNAYFGEKDFQQLLLIKRLTEQLDIKTNVVGCETIREPDGLAMSSRNKLMSDKERKSAKEIIKLLLWTKEAYSKFDFIQIRDEIKNRSKLIDSFKLEYFEIMNLAEFSNISKILENSLN